MEIKVIVYDLFSKTDSDPAEYSERNNTTQFQLSIQTSNICHTCSAAITLVFSYS